MPYHIIEMIRIGPFHIRTWGLLVGLGLAAGLFTAAWAAQKRGIPTDKLYKLAFVGAIAGIFGARIGWAMQPAEIGQSLAHPLRFISFWQPGLTLVGGLILGFGAAIIYAWRARVPLRRTFDAVVVGLGPTVTIGRIGCFLTGLHPGKPTSLPWGIEWLGAVRHPIPLYESALGVVLLAFTLFLYRRRLPAGTVALAGGIFYLVGRSLLDLLRATGVPGADPRLLAGLTLTQTISLFVVPAMMVTMYFLAKRRESQVAVA
ncbi:MAG: prolipoprotein diacylglyceryl transferase [Actinobacteria bacterium]|nr:prolipoprotein diacylglyceryl transferase [Actinomycetota bacterium]